MTSKMDDSSYFHNKIETIPESGCWIWMGTLGKTGYALGNRGGKTIRVHRWWYIKIKGDIGELQLDHLCRVRCCVNPDHLEPVTNRVNVLRGQSPVALYAKQELCKRGHQFSIKRQSSNGVYYRFCRICNSQNMKRWKAEQRDLRNAAIAALKGASE